MESMRSIVLALSVFTALMSFNATAADQIVATQTSAAPEFSCSGDVHAKTLGFWENAVRKFSGADIRRGVVEGGNVYVMYNIQEYLQSFVEMTRRCKDRPQIAELVETLSPAFDALQPLPNIANARGWVCRGGDDCTHANRLINTEVQLCSVQFLGLLGALATDIVEAIPLNQQTSAEKIFVIHTADTIANQLDRWLSSAYFALVATRIKMTPQAAVDGQSKYFFGDKDLWIIDLLSDLSELHQAHVKQSADGMQSLKSLQAKHTQIKQLIDFFLSRVTLSKSPDGVRAEIDRAYWRNFADFQYALYDGKENPVVCGVDPKTNAPRKTIVIAKSSKFIDLNMGWDFSHARRLVPALDTLSRNTQNLSTVFGYKNSQLNPDALIAAFSNQITAKLWNQDMVYPLFSNFWDGENGWYRVAYDSATGCEQGIPPYGLTISFPTGGYPEWGATNPHIHTLSIRLYQLSQSNDPTAQAFINKYYPSLSGPIDAKIPLGQNIWKLSFDSSLVGL